ncbi:ISL3 family transposase [Adlercreutzia sp. ZJ154]|uniref:ISL3 family transposase n=1 Tax=Adlercreutzia sp. ZJ154 TaxID=2709790 RepID=UPI0013EE0781|nr:ISL3 family transposase [Adlercreutzia sp. ZJ154]
MCGHRAQIHGSAKSTVYHIPYAGKPCLITLKKRRYRCPSCNKTFTENQPLISRLTPHVSKCLETFVQDELEHVRTIAELERITGASKNIIAKLEMGVQMPKRHLSHNLCIDEVRVFSKKIAIKRGDPHMSCCIYDADKKTLVDMLKGDGSKTVTEYMEGFTKGERDAVATVSCDLRGSYIHLAEKLFPGAVIYADKFHVSKLVTGALDCVRKRLTHTIEDDKAHTEQRKAMHRASKLILIRKDKLKQEKQRTCVRSALEIDKADELKRAYLALQLFFEWSDTTYKNRDEMELALKRWISIAKRTSVPEIRSVVKTINKRMPYILNAWEYRRTNAVAESLSRQIKDIIRNCRGFMSFATLRHRCLLVLGHKRESNKPIPLFTRSDKRKERAN